VDQHYSKFARIVQNYATVCMAVDVAEKKFNPKRRFGGQSDVHSATELLDHISGSAELIEARLRVACLEAQSIIDNHWNEVTAVAESLMEHKALSAKQVREIILKGRDRLGRALC
jgi:hypothetical protein